MDKCTTNHNDFLATTPGKHRRWAFSTLALTVCLLLSVACVTVYYDPFFQYHAPLEGHLYKVDNQAYQNPGLMRNTAYDSMLTGTSITETFRPSWFMELGGKRVLKTTYSGASPLNIEIAMRMALESNPQCQTIYLGLDFLPFTSADIDALWRPIPEYLYDSTALNNAPYVLNKEVLFEYTLYAATHNEAVSFERQQDNFGVWRDETFFGLQSIIAAYQSHQSASTDTGLGTVKSVIANLEAHIYPVIEQYPKCTFVIFDTPYFALRWFENVTGNITREDAFEVRRQYISKLLEYRNVEFHLFDERSFIGEPYNYTDLIHFSEPLSKDLTRCLFTGQYQLTQSNFESRLRHWEKLVTSYDPAILTAEGNPFVGITDLPEYLKLLHNDRYVTIVAADIAHTESLPAVVQEGFAAIGLSPDFSGRYVAVSRWGKPIVEMASKEAVYGNSDILGDRNIRMEAYLRWDGTQYARILIENPPMIEPVVYSCGTGINIVVYDTTEGRVLHNARFSPQVDGLFTLCTET